MAKFRPSPLIGAISGDLGGANFVAAAGAPVVRQRRTHVPAATNPRIAAGARLKRINDNWRAFTDAQRDQWNTLAATLRTTNQLGLAYPRTGKALYTEHLLYGMQAGVTQIPVFPVAQPHDKILSLQINIGGAQNVILTPVGSSYIASLGCLCYASWLYSNFARKSPPIWRFVKQINFGKPPSPNLYPEALNIFGEVRVGQTIAVLVRPWASGTLATPPVWATATR